MLKQEFEFHKNFINISHGLAFYLLTFNIYYNFICNSLHLVVRMEKAVHVSFPQVLFVSHISHKQSSWKYI